MPDYVRHLCLGVVLLLSTAVSASASFVSSTVLQSGYKIDTSEGRAAKVGSFSFSPGVSSYTDIRLNSWISMIPGMGDAPTLAFTQYQDFDSFTSFINFSTFATGLQINQPVTPSFSVNPNDSGWVSLTSTQGASLANLINSDPFGRVTVFLFSSNYKDFDLPRSTTNFTFSPITGVALDTTFYNTTLSLMPVPEPSSIVVFGSLALGFVGHRFRRGLTGKNTLLKGHQ